MPDALDSTVLASRRCGMTSTDVSSLTIEHALLGFLSERPMHGYDIYQQISQPNGLGLVWRIKRSQLYALLARLEGQGYIVASVEMQDGRPPRRVFHMTEAGRGAFEAWLTSPVSRPRELRLDFLAKLYFARREGPEVVFQLVHVQRVRCREWLAEHSALAEACQPDHGFERLVWQFRSSQLEAILTWLDDCGRDPREPG